MRPTLESDFVVEQTRRLEEARLQLVAAPNDIDARIWQARRTAYLGRYGQAVTLYSEAIELQADDPRLYRHRGHRLLTLRQLDAAITDFRTGLALTEGQPDRVEPDGLPNAANQPTSTLQSNLWYHLGLAHFVRGGFAEALEAYEQCLAVSKNPDGVVSASYWLYQAAARLGRTERAAEVLAAISPEMELLENHDYRDLLLLFKGAITLEELAASRQGASALSSATLAYGIGAWHALEGRQQQADEIWLGLTEGDSWAAFGTLAAEGELARQKKPPPDEEAAPAPDSKGANS